MFEVSDSDRLLAEAAGVITRRDAEILLAHAWNISRGQLLARDREPVPADVIARFTDACARRARGVPVAYLLGRREFWSLDFEVTSAVLVPRPETELLVERALALVGAGTARVVDLGTGSGAIALALAHERPHWELTATDASADALAVARRNGERLAPGRLEWLLGEWFVPLAGRHFDAVVSNPPYIPDSDRDTLHPQVRDHEPPTALFAGPTGLNIYRRLIPQAYNALKPKGLLALEIGHGQQKDITTLLPDWQEVSFVNDLQQIPRVALARKPANLHRKHQSLKP
jgi:release factor glutamine methyltransferase